MFLPVPYKSLRGRDCFLYGSGQREASARKQPEQAMQITGTTAVQDAYYTKKTNTKKVGQIFTKDDEIWASLY